MSIPRFYCLELNTASELFELPSQVHHHVIQVLRLKQGAPLRLFNGCGLEYDVVLEQNTKRRSFVTLTDKVINNSESPLNITLLQGISRGERMDYALQKAVELGVNRIIPVVSERCNVSLSGGRDKKRLHHWQGVIISACEQSGRALLPELMHVMQLDEALLHNKASYCLVLDPNAETGFTHSEKQEKAITILIGPEGGLSEQEIQQAIEVAYQPVKLGPRMLRTETATAAALTVVQTLWGDLG